MVELIRWTDRTWTFTLPVRAFPAVLERIRGTAARARELVDGSPDSALSRRVSGAWSVKEHLGHLSDLSDLDDRRLGEFLARAETLTAADMSNRRTERANHNASSMADILERLRRDRVALVTRMEALSEEEVGAQSMHPRLQQRVRLIDWAYFVAEHDDHHLAAARRTLIRALG